MSPWSTGETCSRHPAAVRTALARLPAALVALAYLVIAGCGESGTTEPTAPRVAFDRASVDLTGGSGQVRLENLGERAVGPVAVVAETPIGEKGAAASDLAVEPTPSEIPEIAAGASVTLTLTVTSGGTSTPGTYGSRVEARLEGRALDSLSVSFTLSPPAPASVRIIGPAAPRQGDVVTYTAEVRDSAGALINNPPALVWSALPLNAGLMTSAGGFVGYNPGAARIFVRSGPAEDSLAVTIQDRGLTGTFEVLGHGSVTARFTSDLWVHGDAAYTGTWGNRVGLTGDRLYVWDIGDPAAPTPTDSVEIDAGTVNDVKVRADGLIGVITHEGSSDGADGITFLDLSDPLHPTVIARFTSGLESGVHNVWIEGNFVYVALDAADATVGGLRVIEIADPRNPQVVASFYAGSSFLHDVYVRDGLAFLAHWDAGLVILDVGNGIAGGSPRNPVEVSRIQTLGGQTHNAWYWPATGYVFVGEEDLGPEGPGVMHVVDASDLRQPREVATFAVPGATPHNFWMDEDRAILYAAWYENGVRAVDVSGTLFGKLDREGREIASVQYASAGACFTDSGTCTWAPQLVSGLVFASDLNSGLWILRPSF